MCETERPTLFSVWSLSVEHDQHVLCQPFRYLDVSTVQNLGPCSWEGATGVILFTTVKKILSFVLVQAGASQNPFSSLIILNFKLVLIVADQAAEEM